MENPDENKKDKAEKRSVPKMIGIFLLLFIVVAAVITIGIQEITFSENEPEMVFVKGGIFTRGLRLENKIINPRKVQIDDFYIGKYEVTQKEWENVMGNNPSKTKGDKLPVENVSWDDSQTFIRKLNERTGKNYRLPTSAEWEYAALGGEKSMDYIYSGGNNLSRVGWYSENSQKKVHEVGLKEPNELGIYDMSGNVAEWCRNWIRIDTNNYIDNNLRKNDDIILHNPHGPKAGNLKISRGGSFADSEFVCEVRTKMADAPDWKSATLGLRLAMDREE